MTRRAFIGDLHGCIDELKELHALLIADGVDEVWHAGDLVDRGPDSHAVIQFCIQNNIKGIMGNHDASICSHWERANRPKPDLIRNPDKAKTVLELDRSDIKYLSELPYYHVFDDIKTVLVHGGMEPGRALWNQSPALMCRAQLLHVDSPGKTKWFNKGIKGELEEDLRLNGWERWYRLWDHEYNVVFGHSCFTEPMVYTNALGGKCIGVDTACCFGGKLTAVILPDMKFISVKAHKAWSPDKPDHIRDAGGEEKSNP